MKTKKVFVTLLSIFLIVIFGSGLASTAHADLITFQFSGTVCCFIGELPVSVGDAVSGSYSFDPLTPPLDLVVATQYRGAVKALDFHVGPFSGSLSDMGTNVIQIANGTPGPLPTNDIYIVETAVSGPALSDGVSNFTPTGFRFRLIDSTATAFTTDALPQTPPDLSLFNEKLLFIDILREGGFFPFPIPASLDSLTLVPRQCQNSAPCPCLA